MVLPTVNVPVPNAKMEPLLLVSTLTVRSREVMLFSVASSAEVMVTISPAALSVPSRIISPRVKVNRLMSPDPPAVTFVTVNVSVLALPVLFIVIFPLIVVALLICSDSFPVWSNWILPVPVLKLVTVTAANASESISMLPFVVSAAIEVAVTSSAPTPPAPLMPVTASRSIRAPITSAVLSSVTPRIALVETSSTFPVPALMLAIDMSPVSVMNIPPAPLLALAVNVPLKLTLISFAAVVAPIEAPAELATKVRSLAVIADVLFVRFPARDSIRMALALAFTVPSPRLSASVINTVSVEVVMVRLLTARFRESAALVPTPAAVTIVKFAPVTSVVVSAPAASRIRPVADNSILPVFALMVLMVSPPAFVSLINIPPAPPVVLAVNVPVTAVSIAPAPVAPIVFAPVLA